MRIACASLSITQGPANKTSGSRGADPGRQYENRPMSMLRSDTAFVLGRLATARNALADSLWVVSLCGTLHICNALRGANGGRGANPLILPRSFDG